MKIADEELKRHVKTSFSFREVIRKCGIPLNSGSTYGHYKNRIRRLNVDTSHFRQCGRNFGKNHIGGSQKLTWHDLLIERSNGERIHSLKLRRAYVEYCKEKGIAHECVKCHNKGMWLDKPMKLEISHINDRRDDNKPENLEWICPNCHAIK